MIHEASHYALKILEKVYEIRLQRDTYEDHLPVPCTMEPPLSEV